MLNKRSLIFGVVDHPSVECRTCPVLLGLPQLIKSIISRSRRSAEDANDQRPIVGDELFHRRGTMVGHLQEQGSSGGCDTRQGASNVVVEKASQVRNR